MAKFELSSREKISFYTLGWLNYKEKGSRFYVNYINVQRKCLEQEMIRYWDGGKLFTNGVWIPDTTTTGIPTKILPIHAFKRVSAVYYERLILTVYIPFESPSSWSGNLVVNRGRLEWTIVVDLNLAVLFEPTSIQTRPAAVPSMNIPRIQISHHHMEGQSRIEIH